MKEEALLSIGEIVSLHPRTSSLLSLSDPSVTPLVGYDQYRGINISFVLPALPWLNESYS